jgi:hypothetical protein
MPPSSQCSFKGWMGVTLCFLLYLNNSCYAQYQQQQEQTGTWNTADYYKREHSLTKPYTGIDHHSFDLLIWYFIRFFLATGTGWQIPYWDFHGSTIVTNQHIRLTPDLRSQQGAIWNSVVWWTFIEILIYWLKGVQMRNWEVIRIFKWT